MNEHSISSGVVDGLEGALTTAEQYNIAVGINDLKRVVSRCAHDHGWWSDNAGEYVERNMGEMIALMHSELSEALEAYRDGDNWRQLRYEYPTNVDGCPSTTVLYQPDFTYQDGSTELGKPVGVASEFADVIIRILDTCDTLGIPITEALLRKHNYNLTRPYRHGGKLA
jgi:hypothetical protein